MGSTEIIDDLDGALTWAFPRLIVAIVILITMWLVADCLWMRLRYPDVATRRLARRRQKIERDFDLKIGRISRRGWLKIAPGQTERWQRLASNAEFAGALGVPVDLHIDGSKVQVRTPPDVGEVEGRFAYEPMFGSLTIGVDVETGEQAEISLAQKSCAVVAGLPGAGKSMVLEGLAGAIRPYGDVTIFDGKISNPDEAVAALEKAQLTMVSRLKSGVDFWGGDRQGQKICVVVLDECQSLFSSSTSTKSDKAAAEHRIALVRDIAQRGRSAGVLAVLGTQRPTADSIPTSIRDLAGVLMCGHVKRGSMVEVVLGRWPEPGDPSPVGAPTGRMVVDDGSGCWRGVQIYHPPR